MSKPTRVYIAGPMTGIPDFNRPAFQQAWNALTQAGFGAVSPHFLESTIEIESRVKMGPGQVYRYALPIDLFALSSVDAVVALPGWQDSRGCQFEWAAAELMEITWVHSREWEPIPPNEMKAVYHSPGTIIDMNCPFRPVDLTEYLERCIELLKGLDCQPSKELSESSEGDRE